MKDAKAADLGNIQNLASELETQQTACVQLDTVTVSLSRLTNDLHSAD